MKGQIKFSLAYKMCQWSCTLHSYHCTLSMQNGSMHLQCWPGIHIYICVLKNFYLGYVSDQKVKSLKSNFSYLFSWLSQRKALCLLLLWRKESLGSGWVETVWTHAWLRPPAYPEPPWQLWEGRRLPWRRQWFWWQWQQPQPRASWEWPEKVSCYCGCLVKVLQRCFK